MAVKVGMITPSSNTVLEPVTIAMTASILDEISVHFTRVGVTAIALDPARASQFGTGPMLAAARLLADAKVDVIAWNGTSGSWQGPWVDEALCQAIADEVGVPATTSTLAILDAFRVLGVKRYGLAVPYTDDVREAIERTYAREGLSCEASVGLGLTANLTFAALTRDDIRNLIRRANAPEAEAVAVVCTNVAAAWVLEEMERELGKPIVDSTVVTLWHALRRVGKALPLPGWGRLVSSSRAFNSV